MIRRARERLGLSQKEFGSLLGKVLGRPVSQSQISDWERGGREPVGSVLLAVAAVSGTTIDELAKDVGGESSPRQLVERVARVEQAGDQVNTAAALEAITARLLRVQAKVDGLAETESDLQRRVALLEARGLEIRNLPGTQGEGLLLDRVTTLEATVEFIRNEVRAISGSLAQIISILDQAGLWLPVAQGKEAEESESEAEAGTG